MPKSVDWSRAFKFSGSEKYFNISVIWIFYYKYAIRLFYYLHLHPHLILFSSIISGIISAVFIWQSKLILAAVFLHLKDVFDACDGSVARLTGRTSIFGRFMDSLGDMFVLTLVIAAITIKSFQSTGNNWIFLSGVFTWFSLFLQCSYFNYYNLRYSRSLQKDNLDSNINEKKAAQDNSGENPFVRLLRFKYNLLYGWQDRMIESVDKLTRAALTGLPAFDPDKYYRHKTFLTLNSALCFGTHIFIFILCLLFGNPALALLIISVIFNIYFLAVIAGRYLYFKAQAKTN